MKTSSWLAAVLLLVATSAYGWRIETPLGEAKGDDPDEVLRDTVEKVEEGIRAPGKIPGMLWEGATNPFREVFAQSGSAGLQEWIARSRDDALRAGVQQMPFQMKQKLRRYYPDSLLNKVQYRVGASGDLALQNSVFNLGGMAAIALDYVIVFRNADQAQWDDKLWAHEVAHIDQYQSWGTRDFAIRYLRDFNAVGGEANRRADEYAATSAPMGAPPQFIPAPAPAIPVRYCRTMYGTCSIPPAMVPMATPCFCSDGHGSTANGQAF